MTDGRERPAHRAWGAMLSLFVLTLACSAPSPNPSRLTPQGGSDWHAGPVRFGSPRPRSGAVLASGAGDIHISFDAGRTWEPLTVEMQGDAWSVGAFEVSGPTLRLRGDGAAPSLLEVSWSNAERWRGLKTKSASSTSSAAPRSWVGRADWGASAPRCASTAHEVWSAVLHHTAIAPHGTPGETVRAIQAYHQHGRGWCDIGYHALIAPDGRVFEGRPLEMQGAHVAGANHGRAGIALMGCHDHECDHPTAPTAQALRAARTLLRELAPNGHAQHRDLAPTACPGALVPRVLREHETEMTVEEETAFEHPLPEAGCASVPWVGLGAAGGGLRRWRRGRGRSRS